MYALLSALSTGFALYMLTILYFSEQLMGDIVQRFESEARRVEIYKQKVVMVGLLAEAEIATEQKMLAPAANTSDVTIYQLKADAELTDEERIVHNVLNATSRLLPGFLSDDKSLLYYRSYQGRKLITYRPIADFELQESFFDERCLIHLGCTNQALEFQLEDRVIITPPYEDLFSGQWIFTISSPVYKHGEIIGDINVDYRIGDTELAHYRHHTEARGLYHFIHFSDDNYPFGHLAHVNEYIADNRTVIIQRVAFSKLFAERCWMYAVLSLFLFVFFFKWSESKHQRSQLDEVMTSVNRDELTQLYNRKIFKDSELQNLLKEEGASVIAVDGDRIKQINDNYGHDVGDQAIKHIAESMSSVFRKSDYLVRCGGDEFLIILPGCSLQRANQLAKKLKMVTAEQLVTVHKLTVKVSTGAVEIRQYESLKSAILRADENLYQEKRLRDQREQAIRR